MTVSPSSQGFSPQLNNYMSTAKIFGEPTHVIRGSINFSALMASDPSLPWYWNIVCIPEDPSEALSTEISCTITMIQYTELNRRKALSST